MQGFVQSKQPAAAHKVQIYYAANALVSALQDLNLSREQHVELWKNLFTGAPGGAPGQTSGAAPHRLTSIPPVAQVVDPGVASVVPLGQPELANYPYAHQNTDYASKWRVTLGANITAGTTAFQVNFGTHHSDTALAPHTMGWAARRAAGRSCMEAARPAIGGWILTRELLLSTGRGPMQFLRRSLSKYSGLAGDKSCTRNAPGRLTAAALLVRGSIGGDYRR